MRPAQVSVPETADIFQITSLSLSYRTFDKEAVVLAQSILSAPTCMRPRPLSLLVLSFCLSGCAAMIQDVHLYYQQMAVNYKEAEEKAKLDASRLEGESAALLEAGDLHKCKRSERELARIKNWQEYCARQYERFLKAADNTAKPADTHKNASQNTPPNSQ
jgi:hypothetical protein